MDTAAPRSPSLAATLATWLAHERGTRAGPLKVGVHGPQGSGKSTLCEALVAELGALDLRATSVSVDDFYLTHADQRRLATEYPGNDYLEYRGYPGTHDLALGERTLHALANSEVGEVSVPRYDKSAHGGRGERRPAAEWSHIATPLDVVLVEGWMLAFEPAPLERVSHDAHLAVTNQLLAEYASWRGFPDLWIVLALDGEDPGPILRWRLQAEHHRRELGQPALDDDAARDYVRRFLPAYRLWSPSAARVGVRVTLGPAREVIRLERLGLP